jgi:hypothetical protein
MKILGGLALAVLLLACQGEHREAPPRPAPARPALAPGLVRLPAAARLVAIGDLHGDLAATRAALRAGGLIDPSDHWQGGSSVVVQTGDLLDRADDEPEILALFDRLRGEAAAQGGKVVTLLGNHELMNAAGDLRYVTPDGFADYGGEAGRRQAFAPGGAIARHLAESSSYAIIGDTVFVHGGIEPGRAKDLAALDAEARAWLAGTGRGLPALLTDDHGPVWSRRFGGLESPEVCAAAAATLATLQVHRMVVGHTPQAEGISSICHGQVVRIDVGMTTFYGGPIQVLVLGPAGAEISRGQR